MADNTKFGARHSAKDRELILSIRQGARDIDQAAVDLGAPDEATPDAPAKSADKQTTETPLIWGVVKAAGDWTLDVLAIPYGGPDNLDSDGEYFDAKTALHPDKWPSPPAVYYHGMGPDKKPLGDPEYIGRTVKRWSDAAGEWVRVVLDKGNAFARRVWEAAQKGIARASSGSIAHLTRVDEGGHIREWPFVEISIFDAVDGRQPANRYAVAIPTAKAIYDRAGLAFQAPEAEPGPESAASAAQNDSSTQDITEAMKMDAIEMQKAIAESVAAAMKAEREAREAEAKVKAEADERAALKAENEALKAQAAEARRLPGGMPYVTKYGFAAKYDNLTPAEHALVIVTLLSPGRAIKATPSDDIVRALAMKVEAEAAKNEGAAEAFRAIKATGLKSDEIMYSTLSGYGSQWVGTLYSRNLWELIRAECWVLDKLQPYADQVPDGFSSDTVPLESTDPTWYKVAEATAHTTGRPDVTVTSSKAATSNKNVTLVKMGCRVTFSGELAEDSLVALAPELVRKMKVSGMEQFEHAIIDGDTNTGASSNINDIAGTPAGTEVFLLVNGFRDVALATSTQYRAGGTLEDTDFLETAKLLGTAGISADVTKCQFIVDMPTYWKSLQLASVKTKDVWQQATLEGGRLTGIWGFPLKQSAFMHYLSTVRKANTAGKVDQDTVANNTTGSIVCVRWDQWRLKWKRQMTFETDRWAESDTNQIVALVRWGLGNRDTTSAASITYGITGV